MPLCHFAYGSLYREGRIEEQAEETLQNILLPKKLLSFPCREFMPILNSPSASWANPHSATVSEDGAIEFRQYTAAPAVALLPMDIFMICFVDIPLKKLRNWSPASHYGKVGIVFKDAFRARANVRNVVYYSDYRDFRKDPKVIALNKAINEGDSRKIEALRPSVVEYRKPARLWPELNNEFVALQVGYDKSGCVSIKPLTYDRYDVGYDFTAEREARILTDEDDREVYFSESDVLAIVTPDTRTQTMFESALEKAWSTLPVIKVFPT